MFFIPSWALGAAVILIAIQIGRAISGRGPRYRRGFPPQSDTDVAEVAELRQSLEAMQRRIGELEERVDFAERLLAKPRDER
jgi:hypothetical protein